MSNANSITDVAAQLNGLLRSKEEELNEREAAFDRRVQLFERENPTTGGDNDVLQLNVGGGANVAVLRRTLTQFEGSMLAAKFSGRWDDSLERDRDGNVFVDEDPDTFLELVKYLRLRNKQTRLQIPIKQPTPTYDLCCMFEYYELMPGIYPQHWIGRSDRFCCERKSYDAVVLTSTEASNADDEETIVLHNFGMFNDAGVSEFNVEFEKGTSGAVGWVDIDRYTAVDWYNDMTPNKSMTAKGISSNNTAVEWYNQEYNDMKPKKSMTAKGISSNSMFLSVGEGAIYGPKTKVLEGNLMLDYRESTTKVVCKRCGGKLQHSIEVVGVGPPGRVVATLDEPKDISNLYPKRKGLIFPMISFSGKVTVTGLKYDIHNL